MAQPEFILVRTELKDRVASDVSTFFSDNDTAGTRRDAVRQFAEFVRRPMRGIQIKEETFATLSVFGIGQTVEEKKTAGLDPVVVAGTLGSESTSAATIPSGSNARMLNSSAPKDTEVNYSSNFLLQTVSEQRTEKFQPITTFGATYGFFFGEQPRMVTFNAILLNTADFQWEVEWWANYEETIRGTRLVDKGLRAYMTYDDVIVEGYILNAVTNKNAQTPYEVNLTFTMWVTGSEFLVEPGDKNYPESDISAVIDFAGANDAIDALANQNERPITTTAAVRAANVAAATTGTLGILGKLRAAISKASDYLNRTYDSAVSFLFGRNLVIPAGFAGSEIGGNAQIVDAQGRVVTLPGALNEGDLALLEAYNVKLPVNLGLVQDPKPRGQFYDNVDEYPVRSGRQFFDASSDIYQTALTATGVLDDSGLTFRDDMAEIDAEAAFAKFGIDVDNMEGKSRNALALSLARTAWGAINLAASASGASQALAGLTVGAIAGGGRSTAAGGAGGSSTR